MPDKSAAGIKVDTLFNQTAVRYAQNQKVLRDWLSGLSDQYPGQTKDNGQIEEEEKGIFTLDPEIAGLGVPAQSLTGQEVSNLDPFTRGEDSSTAFLRQQLIGKKGKSQKPAAVQRSAINLPGVEAGFQVSRVKTIESAQESLTTGSNGGQQGEGAVNVDSAEEEDSIGRTGLGQRKPKIKVAKTARSGTNEDTQTPNPGTASKEPNPSGTQGVSQEAALDAKVTPSSRTTLKRKQSNSKPRARSYLDEMLAQKEAKKQRKKNKVHGE